MFDERYHAKDEDNFDQTMLFRSFAWNSEVASLVRKHLTGSFNDGEMSLETYTRDDHTAAQVGKTVQSSRGK